MKNNKKYSNKLLSMILAVSMILALVPVFTAAIDDELSKYETVEEVPFTFTLEEGDLTFSELKDATLKAGDLPFAISAELAEERGHVNRLYEQETDDYTVMFQNRDGSKTIYLFSQKVKNISISSTSTAALVSSGGEIVINKDNIIAKRLGTSSDNRIMDYQIARCEISTLTQGRLSADGVDITSQAKALANGEASGEELRIECAEVSGVATASPLASQAPQASVMSLTYSTVAGEYALKNNGTSRYMTFHPSAGLLTRSSIYVPLSKWLISYEYVNSTYIYTLTPLAKQMQRLTYSNGRVSCTTAVAGATSQKWEIVIENNDDGSTFVYFLDYNLEYLLDPSFGSVDNSTVPLERCQWILTNHQTFVPLTSITPNVDVLYYNISYDLSSAVTTNPATPSYVNFKWVAADGSELINNGSGFPYDDGIYATYCMDDYSGITSSAFYTVVCENFTFSDSNFTYTIHPKNAPTKYLTMSVNSSQTSNDVIVEGMSSGNNNTYERWDNKSRAFVIETTNGGYKLSAALSTNQYLNVPAGNQITGSYNLQSFTDYKLTTIDDQPNTLNLNGTVRTMDISSSGSTLILYPVDIFENGTTIRYYSIVSASPSTVPTALSYNSSTGNATLEAFDSTDSSQLWTIKHLGINTPLIKQTTNYWCGYTTTLQLLLSKGVDVPGESLNQQIYNVASQSGIYGNPNMPANTYDLHNIINNLTFDNNEFNMSNFGYGATAPLVKDYIMDSLSLGYPAAYVVSDAGPPFTATTSATHFIAIIGYDSTSDRVIISNCHYNDAVFGIYAVDYDLFYQHFSILFWQQAE